MTLGSGQVGRRAFRVDGWNGWRFAQDPNAFEHLEVGSAGLTLARAGLPDADPGTTLSPSQRGLTVDVSGFRVAVTEDGRGICMHNQRGPMEPPDCWGLETLADDDAIVALATRGPRVFMAIPHAGEVRIVRLDPAADMGTLPLPPGTRPSGLGFDGRGRLHVFDATRGAVLIFDPWLRPMGSVALCTNAARDWRVFSVSAEGWMAAGRPGSEQLTLRSPEGESFDVAVRSLLPALAWGAPREGTAPLLFAGDARSGRVVEYALEAAPDGAAPELVPHRWSEECRPWSALHHDGARLLGLARHCDVRPIAFETAGFYAKRATFLLGPFDSRNPDTEWHRLLAGNEIEGAGKVSIQAQLLGLGNCDEEIIDAEPADPRWTAPRALELPRAGVPHELGWVQAHGQFAFLRVTLEGDGRTRPVIGWLRLEYPRESWLSFLPEVFSREEAARDLTARFLSVPQAAHADISNAIEQLNQLFRPGEVDAEFLPWLARRIGLVLSPAWDDATRRRALQRAHWIYERRGTRAALQELLDLTFGTGIRIVEGHRALSGFFLGAHAALGCSSRLPGSCGPRTLRLGRGVRLGEGMLDAGATLAAAGLDEGRGELWLFVPAEIANDPGRRAELDALLEREVPAGARTRVFSHARALLGRSSRLGIHAVLGQHEPWRMPEVGSADADRVGPWLPGREPTRPLATELGRGPRLGTQSRI